MAVNTRFATGVHTLVLLAVEPEVLETSEDLARKLNTNPVIIRRVLGLLQKAKLIESQKGPSGGSKLAKPAKAITLGEIHRALEPNNVFHAATVSGPTVAKIRGALEKACQSAQAAMEQELAKITLNQLVKKLDKKAKK
jgi:Rrf2 family protein